MQGGSPDNGVVYGRECNTAYGRSPDNRVWKGGVEWKCKGRCPLQGGSPDTRGTRIEGLAVNVNFDRNVSFDLGRQGIVEVPLVICIATMSFDPQCPGELSRVRVSAISI